MYTRTLLTLLCGSLLVLPCSGFELLVRAVDNTHTNAEKDRIGSWKRGMVVVAKPDGWNWGTQEKLPTFVIIKVPQISVTKAEKYLNSQFQNGEIYRRRLWKIRWADLPIAARQKLASGTLTIKASASYTGDYDYTWAQIKSYFRNLETNMDETEDL